MKEVARPFMPPRPPDAPPEPDLSARACSEAIVAEAGLLPRSTFDLSWAYEYADEDELSARHALARRSRRRWSGRSARTRSGGGSSRRLRSFQTREGGYRLENEFHVVIAAA